MLMVLNIIGNSHVSFSNFFLLAAALLLIVLLGKISKRVIQHFKFSLHTGSDHEAQVFIGLLICFGFAWSTQLLNLPASLGALLGGVFVSKINGFEWLERQLVPLRVFFLALFFLAIGLQADLRFFMHNLDLVVLLTAGILVINSAINAVVFRVLGLNWRNSIYAGALLSQIGEFGLVLCLAARSQHLVSEFQYQLTLAVISLTMLLTAVWIKIISSFIFKRAAR